MTLRTFYKRLRSIGAKYNFQLTNNWQNRPKELIWGSLCGQVYCPLSAVHHDESGIRSPMMMASSLGIVDDIDNCLIVYAADNITMSDTKEKRRVKQIRRALLNNLGLEEK
jgi:hypothetical protein